MNSPVWEAVMIVAAADVLSLNDHRHRMSTVSRVKTLRTIACQQALISRAPRLRRARLVVTVDFPDRRRRDPHNFTPTAKAIVDGLVDAGVLPDDDHRHLAGPDMRASSKLAGKRMGQPMYAFNLSLYDLGEALP